MLKLQEIALIVIALCLLTACQSSTKQSQVPPSAPADFTVACAKIEPLPEGANLGDLIEFSVDTVTAYKECAARQLKLSEWAELVAPTKPMDSAHAAGKAEALAFHF